MYVETTKAANPTFVITILSERGVSPSSNNIRIRQTPKENITTIKKMVIQEKIVSSLILLSLICF